MPKTIFHDINYPAIPRSANSKARWPQWHDIQDLFQNLGLAEPGHRLPASGFQPITLSIPRYGVATFKCEPQTPRALDRGRHGRPHRLKVRCSCGEWIFFGKLNQHYPSERHARLKAELVTL